MSNDVPIYLKKMREILKEEYGIVECEYPGCNRKPSAIKFNIALCQKHLHIHYLKELKGGPENEN